MCRIDALFNVSSLDEKEDPVERFEQALDEYKIESQFRDLLIKHFSDNWKNVFRDAYKLEKILNNITQHGSDAEKCVSFLVLLFKQDIINEDLAFYLRTQKTKSSVKMDFLHDVVQMYYPSSPFGLFEAGMDKIQGNYFIFVSWVYGQDFCFSKSFFNDLSLNSLNKHERTDIIWSYFNAMAYQFKSLNENHLFKELTSIASSNLVSGPPTKDSLEIVRGFDFLKAWIKSDSQAGRLSYCWFDFFNDYNSPWEKLETLLRADCSGCEETSKLLNKWLQGTKLELEKLLYTSVDLNHVSVECREQWAQGVDRFFTCYTYTHIYDDYNQLTNDDLNIRLSNTLHVFCSELTSLQISVWVKYSVDKDFEHINSSNTNSPSLSSSTEKWINKEYFELWRGLFLESFNEQNIESKLRILSIPAPYSMLDTEGFYLEYKGWLDELFSHLIEQDDFPKNLTPNWTVVAVDRLKREEMLPYIDKSIGILRGELPKAESKELIKSYHQQLEKLLGVLDHSSPRKALRHRLLLMRSSTEPFSDESISKLGSIFERENFNSWYDSLKQLLDTHFAYQTNGNREVTQENYKEVQNNFYLNFSHELAEFCLSRLKLRKGEKAQDGKYDSSQVIEQSPIWRQGYLKALKELGFDLNGKVHKTVNFTKKSDPDKDVRAIASECYKEVRRNTKKSPSIQDIKRGIVAAEWWLLISQRQALDLGINDKEALKTRRNLMRNP